MTSVRPSVARALSVSPSGRLMASTGVFGIRAMESRSGMPHTVVAIPQ